MTPAEAFDLALKQGPADETREVACQSPPWAYQYALEVDRCARDDTRAAACQNPFDAYRYAYSVDKGPHDVTRAAACQNSSTAVFYTREIDLYLHPEPSRTLTPVWLAWARELLEFD